MMMMSFCGLSLKIRSHSAHLQNSLLSLMLTGSQITASCHRSFPASAFHQKKGTLKTSPCKTSSSRGASEKRVRRRTVCMTS